MNILTKICVVVLSVLVILACPIFIKQATTGPNYRLAWQQEQLRSKAYELEAMNEKNAHNATRLQRDQARAELLRLGDQRKVDADKMTAELAATRSTVASLENNLAVLAAKVGGLEREAANFNQRNDSLAAQLAEARKENDDLSKEVVRVSELIKQTEAEKARTEQLARVYQETIRGLEEENDNLRKARPASSAAAPGQPGQASPVAAEEIIGTIDAIKGNLASINIGSAKGVAKNMRLIIYRGTTLVGFLRVDEVDVDQAAGIVVDRRVDPMQGDKVTTRLLQ